MPPTNAAAWLPAPKMKPLKVGDAPYTPPAAHQLVVKNGAVAINPVDGAKQLLGNLLFGYIKHPFILGFDTAGEVVEVGPDVERFKVGDRVLAHTIAAAPESNNPAEGAFQHYSVVREHLAASIPRFLSYEQASVLPLGLVTAIYGLFHSDFLALNLPTLPGKTITEDSPAVIITAGASSVGSCAIQLATAAGYKVYSTSSSKNFAYVKKLGASSVYDYHNAKFADDIITELKGKVIAGAFAIGQGSVEACTKILHKSAPGSKKFVAFAGVPVTLDQLTSTTGMVSLMASTLRRVVATGVISKVRGVPNKFIEIKDVAVPDSVVGKVFREYIPGALAESQLLCMPEPRVVGNGLDSIQEAMDLQLKGVSAQKVVVTL